ncbi:MAG: helix-turn-helix transcriptional regulator [Eubacteriales bacterium]|nr:helix-turn-helix transcriptional regulator [Eubacteriales bacterium]
MSEFSELLSRLIKAKDIKVYSLVKYCKLDRSTMYKIINGKRNPPSLETVGKMAEFMRLTPSEYKDFREAYQLTVVGKDNYYRRKNVEQFILQFPDIISVSPLLPAKQQTAGADTASLAEVCIPIYSQIEFNYYLQHILETEASRTNGKIALILQPDHDFLFSLLTNLKTSGSDFTVEHIFCLSKTQQMTENHEYYNLTYLKKIFLLLINELDYHPYYFYDDIHSHYFNLNIFPGLILTENYAITCTSDYHAGILYHDKKTLNLLWDIFKSYKNKCQPLFNLVHSFVDEISILGQIIWHTPFSYMIQAEPCLVPYITAEILEAVIEPELPNRNDLITYFSQYIAVCKEKVLEKSRYIYCTQQGIERFVNTGRLLEVPDELYRPMNKKQRLQLLEQAMIHCRDVHYRLLKKPLDLISGKLHLCLSSTSGYLLFNTVHGKHVYLIFQEPGLLFAFLDYAESLEDENLYTIEETEKYMKECIARLKYSIDNEQLQ